MSTPAPDTTVIADGKSKLTASVRGKPKWNAWLAAILWSVQDLKTNIYAVINSRNWLVNPPTNDVLTRLASLVGLQRNGQSDPVLWTQVLVQLRLLRSSGLVEDVLQTANLITPSTYTNGDAGKTFAVSSFGISSAAFDPLQLAAALGRAKDGGSRGVLYYSTWPVLDIYSNNQNLYPSSRYGGATVGDNMLASRYSLVSAAGKPVASTEIVGS